MRKSLLQAEIELQETTSQIEGLLSRICFLQEKNEQLEMKLREKEEREQREKEKEQREKREQQQRERTRSDAKPLDRSTVGYNTSALPSPQPTKGKDGSTENSNGTKYDRVAKNKLITQESFPSTVRPSVRTTTSPPKLNLLRSFQEAADDHGPITYTDNNTEASAALSLSKRLNRLKGLGNGDDNGSSSFEDRNGRRSGSEYSNGATKPIGKEKSPPLSSPREAAAQRPRSRPSLSSSPSPPPSQTRSQLGANNKLFRDLELDLNDANLDHFFLRSETESDSDSDVEPEIMDGVSGGALKKQKEGESYGLAEGRARLSQQQRTQKQQQQRHKVVDARTRSHHRSVEHDDDDDGNDEEKQNNVRWRKDWPGTVNNGNGNGKGKMVKKVKEEMKLKSSSYQQQQLQEEEEDEEKEEGEADEQHQTRRLQRRRPYVDVDVDDGDGNGNGNGNDDSFHFSDVEDLDVSQLAMQLENAVVGNKQ